MARASAKRGRRPSAHARAAEESVSAPEAAPAEQPPKPPKPEKTTAAPAPQREPGRLRRKPKAPQRPEDTMFFTRLRTHAKWVFVLLAAAFAIGFVAFGVGAGGTGFGDAIADFFGGGTDTPALEEAQQNVEDNPNDAQAVLDLANAYLADRQLDKAAETLERYAELRPDDVDVLRQLSAVYTQQAGEANQEAGELTRAQMAGTFGQSVYAFPESGGFIGALGQDPIGEALTREAQIDVTEIGETSKVIYAKQADVFARLSELTPEDPQVFLQLAQAATLANEADQAIPAYERFLELAPDDPSAQGAREQLEFLRSEAEETTG
jgi:tetratricopeptide (TPR) repeat protein